MEAALGDPGVDAVLALRQHARRAIRHPQAADDGHHLADGVQHFGCRLLRFLIALRDEMRRLGIRRIHLAYHGTTDPARYGNFLLPIVEWWDSDGLACVSVDLPPSYELVKRVPMAQPSPPAFSTETAPGLACVDFNRK